MTNIKMNAAIAKNMNATMMNINRKRGDKSGNLGILAIVDDGDDLE